MTDCNLLNPQAPAPEDSLQILLKQGAQQLLQQAIEAELQELLDQFRSLKTQDDKQAVVRIGGWVNF